jgi:hypothetical protein
MRAQNNSLVRITCHDGNVVWLRPSLVQAVIERTEEELISKYGKTLIRTEQSGYGVDLPADEVMLLLYPERQQALPTLTERIKEDPEYAWTWHCNLACAGMDAGLGHQAANAMAGNFMKLAFGAEVDKYTPGTKSVEETCEGHLPQPDETAQGYIHVTTKEQDAEYEAEHHAMEDKMFLETVHALVKEQQSTKTVGEKGETTSADETAQRGPVA